MVEFDTKRRVRTLACIDRGKSTENLERGSARKLLVVIYNVFIT